jgi:hypothetical protein
MGFIIDPIGVHAVLGRSRRVSGATRSLPWSPQNKLASAFKQSARNDQKTEIEAPNRTRRAG